jgi:cysteine synthase A
MKLNNILESIGNTPHLKLNSIFEADYNVWMKLERNNPGSSIKDRIALAMIEDAESKGLLNPDTVIIEPTSGNTGIGLAMVAAVKGYEIILVMPESMSIERRKLMASYGAKFVLTPREKGMKGAIEQAKKLVEENKNSWMPMQFDNKVNVKAHMETTAQEILNDFPEGLDFLVTGVGTGGHITGCAKILKNKFPNLKIFAVEPELSPVLSGGAPSPHPIQGIGAGFIPSILEVDLLDGIVQVSKDDAFKFTKKSASEEGVLVGISSGASLAAVNKLISDGTIKKGNTVLTFCYDTGERYLSIEGLFDVPPVEVARL